MISIASIFAMCVTLLISLVVPVGVFVLYGTKKNRNDVWMAGILGAVGFGVLQISIRLPLLNSLAARPGFADWVEHNYIWYCLFLAFTAGLFEVIARYATAKILCYKNKITYNLTYEAAFLAGIGHGGIEAVMIVGMTYVNNLLFSFMINAGAWDSMLAEIKVSAEQMGDMSIYQVYETVPQQLIGTPWYLYLAAGYERILTMVAHIAMTMIVFYFVGKKKDAIGVLICLFCHTLLDFVSVLLSGMSTDYLGNVLSQNVAYVFVYVFLTVIAGVAIWFLIHISKFWKIEKVE